MTADPPLTEGVTAALVGVTDFTEPLEFYCGRLGFDVVAQGAVPDVVAGELWGTDNGVEVRVLAAAGAAGGRIHLLRVVDSGATARWPDTLDIGLGGVNLYAADIAATHARLTGAGYAWVAPPSSYTVPMGGREIEVTEGICHGPQGTGVVFVQPASPRGTAAWDADPTRLHTELTSVVCHVPDVDAEAAFWGGLGFDPWYDVTMSSPGLEAMTGLPPGTRLRLAFLVAAATARIELIHVVDNPGGADLRALQRPGRSVGHSGWSLRVRDLGAALRVVRDRGGRLLGGPVETDDPLHGRARAACVDTPNGLAAVLWEPLG